MKMRSFAIFAALAAVAAACGTPKYVSYEAVSRDFTVAAPWGWNVIADADHEAFAQVVFVGPFDKDFYLGAPSLSVRWYRPWRPHTLRDGSVEMYAGSADFIHKTLKDVYGYPGAGAAVYGGNPMKEGEYPLGSRTEIEEKDVPTIVLRDSGLKARYFAVLSPTPAGYYDEDLQPVPQPNGTTLLPVAHKEITVGTLPDPKTGHRVNQRYHEYVVVPIAGADGREEGFYVLCCPSTLAGHNKSMDRFRALINTFHPYTAGPGGEKIKIPGPSRASADS
jgi:hypothetical protein